MEPACCLFDASVLQPLQPFAQNRCTSVVTRVSPSAARHTFPPSPQLVSMGFTENGSKRAALAVGNSSAEAATNWVMEHLEDADLNDPLPPPGEFLLSSI